MKNHLLYLVIALIFIGFSCKEDTIPEIIPEPVPEPVELEISPDLALAWSELTLDVMKDSPFNSPTYGSRALGYIGLTMYESVVNGSIIFQSVTESLNGFAKIAKPDTSKSIDWEIVLNAGQEEIINSLFSHAPDEVKLRIDSLYTSLIDSKKADSTSQKTIDDSDLYGKLVARQIFEWSKLDKGHEGYKITFDRNYPYPIGPTYWSPPAFGQASVAAPLHPYWGENRTFSALNSQLEIPEFIESNKDTSSAYFKEMKLVYDVNKALTQEEKEIALWWGDDPSASASPPGHSYYLTRKLIEKEQNNLFEATSAFAKVGMSVADAFINVFKCKYFYHAERPRNYIIRNIDSRWTQFWPEPPFPAFTSGHSTQASAAATAMISVFGDDHSFSDEFHTGRPWDSIRKVEFKTRHFDSIWQTAEECGWSRILGGIHTPQDNVVGLSEGKKIGENINSLPWKIE